MDVDQTNIAAHFDEVADFIDQALSAGGKVLVNCQMGMSRSPACVLAYLIIRHGMTVGQAIQQVGRTSSRSGIMFCVSGTQASVSQTE